MKLLKREELERSIGFKFAEKNLLITFHPVTLEKETSARQMEELLAALEGLTNTNLIFTMPNADPDSRVLFEMIEGFVADHTNAIAHTSLGQLRYFSCVKYVDGVVGNSSSGLTEVPSFGKGTINIGDRQLGRLRAESVIDCAPEREAISAGLKKLYSSDFQKKLKGVVNPNGTEGANKRILKVLQEYPLHNLLKKSFYDLADK